ncbi:unnamed protein product [Ceratitis capitata]|uniref:(Mediterranean fruit fly) hypothetical protein n=1 Tax=Ceratitis capitata TaxID=7213 RepID=A0A811U5I5_CERCA|nr:unnamed protein product [Ceratitis capitata]
MPYWPRLCTVGLQQSAAPLPPPPPPTRGIGSASKRPIKAGSSSYNNRSQVWQNKVE